MATVAEPAVEVIDGELARLGGEVTRRPVPRGRSRTRGVGESGHRRCSGVHEGLVEVHQDRGEPKGVPLKAIALDAIERGMRTLPGGS